MGFALETIGNHLLPFRDESNIQGLMSSPQKGWEQPEKWGEPNKTQQVMLPLQLDTYKGEGRVGSCFCVVFLGGIFWDDDSEE